MMTDDRRVVVLGDLVSCRGRERELQARFLECLGEFDAQQWYTFEACSSTFAFLTKRMKFGGHSAWKRLTTARVARRFPFILDWIRRGRLHMTGVARIAKWLDDDHGESRLRSIAGLSTRQIEEFIADLDPKPVGDSSVTSSEGCRETSTPLGDGNWKVELYADAKLKALIDEAKDLAPHGVDLAVVVEQALARWIERRRNRKVGAVARGSVGERDLRIRRGLSRVLATFRRGFVDRSMNGIVGSAPSSMHWCGDVRSVGGLSSTTSTLGALVVLTR